MLAWVMNMGFAASPSNAPVVTTIHNRGFVANVGTLMMVRTLIIFLLIAVI